MRAAPLLCCVLALAGCNAIRQSTSMFPNRSRDWHRVATEDDQTRLRDWRSSFTAALASARQAGASAAIAAEGPLLKPEAGIPGAELPRGDYRCRLIDVGSGTAGTAPFVVTPVRTCRVTPQGALEGLAVLAGGQRQIGVVLPSDPLRQVFLGTLMLSDETRAMQYGADEKRDIAGYVERIGPARWRLLLPSPHFGPMLQVVDMVPPAGAAPVGETR